MTHNNKDVLSRDFNLVDRASSSAGVTIRDDQYEFPWLLDAVRVCKKHGGRFRLVDSGKRDIVSLSWLAEAGADVYTSDESRPDPKEIIPVRMAARNGGALTFYYIGGDTTWTSGPALFLPDIDELGRIGVDLHLSNREKTREARLLLDLSRDCRSGGGRLVYYHHGRLNAALEDVAEAGGWIHCAAQNLDTDPDLFLLRDILAAARRAGSGLILHLDKGAPLSLAREAFERGAFLRFHTAPSERSSAARKLQDESARRRLDPRACYLQCDFLP